jgi:hypothetical protein
MILSPFFEPLQQGGSSLRRNRKYCFKIGLRECARIKREEEIKGNRGLSGKLSS